VLRCSQRYIASRWLRKPGGDVSHWYLPVWVARCAEPQIYSLAGALTGAFAPDELDELRREWR
jgi:hypothetical protein